MILFRKRYVRADNQTLNSCFERPANEEIQESVIKRFDIDKFKPLCNFLKAESRTDEKNIELLAWLIDFRLHPCAKYWREFYDYGGIARELTTVPAISSETRPSLSKLYVGERKARGHMVKRYISLFPPGWKLNR